MKKKVKYIYCEDYKNLHFLITQSLVIIVALIITGLMQLSNYLAKYLFYCFPVLLLYAAIEYFTIWKYHLYKKFCVLLLKAILMMSLAAIFFVMFFYIFHPTASLEFKQVDNCQVIGSLTDSIQNREAYSILYVNFEHEGQSYLGQACASSQSKGALVNSIFPYHFYEKFDEMICGNSIANKTDHNDARVLQDMNEQNNSTTINTKGSRFLSSTRNTCMFDYLWSKVKIASWVCLERGFDYETYTQKQPCYMTFFSGEQAVENGLNRSQMKNSSQFPLISFQERPYYPQADLICLIIFCYYPWLQLMNFVFIYISEWYLDKNDYTRRVVDRSEEKEKNKNEEIQQRDEKKSQTNAQDNSVSSPVNRQPNLQIVQNHELANSQTINYDHELDHATNVQQDHSPDLIPIQIKPLDLHFNEEQQMIIHTDHI